jgi:hypothetical protein
MLRRKQFLSDFAEFLEIGRLRVGSPRLSERTPVIALPASAGRPATAFDKSQSHRMMSLSVTAKVTGPNRWENVLTIPWRSWAAFGTMQ